MSDTLEDVSGDIQLDPKVYYVSLSVYRNVDVFTRKLYADSLIEALQLYQEEYGLLIYDWVLMSGHLRMIVSPKEGSIKKLIKDFKRYTTWQIFYAIENNPAEQRKKWLLKVLRGFDQSQVFWRGDYQAQTIYFYKYYLMLQNRMYQEPVEQGLVEKKSDYHYSSCKTKMGEAPGVLALENVRLTKEQLS